jgi:hypothetical protein
MFSLATLGIIGAVTGIVGAITGLAGFVLGWTNYRRLQQIKALDLRLELRKQVSDVRTVVEALPDLLERSRKSRSAVLAAKGLLQTGAFKIWKAALESDLKTAQALARELPDTDETYQRSKHQNLETKLVEVHALAVKAARLRDKYLTELASDDKEREHIRADASLRWNTTANRKSG